MITTIIIGVLAVITIAIFTEIIKSQHDQLSELKIDHARLEVRVAELERNQ